LAERREGSRDNILVSIELYKELKIKQKKKKKGLFIKSNKLIVKEESE
jgi:hypothetical protein